MNDLRTYRKYSFYNKFLDTFTLLLIFMIIISLFYFLYYTTKSFIIIFIVMILIYIIGLFIAKLFEIKIVMPTILYILICSILLAFIAFNEKDITNIEVIKGVLIMVIIMALIFFAIAIYKYETPVAIYFKVKDYFLGISYGKKVKKRKLNYTKTNTTYACNLLFEKEKLINQLEEDYQYEYVRLDADYNKALNNKDVANSKLKDLEEVMQNINKKLQKKNSGAQDYELSVQLKVVKEKILTAKEELAILHSEVKNKHNELEKLKTTLKNNIYYISNAYNMRYRNYIERIEEKLTSTNIKLEKVPFNADALNIEGEI